MRQCQQESRIATQLMHIRKQKDTIRNNRCRYTCMCSMRDPLAQWLMIIIHVSDVCFLKDLPSEAV